eukprot:gene27704-7346_t
MFTLLPGQSKAEIDGLNKKSVTKVMKNPGGYCAELFQLEWYSIFFELAILAAMLVTCCMDAFERGRYIYLSYLSIVTFLLSLTARNFIANSFKIGGIDLQDMRSDAYTATAAGAIMLCVVNFALIIFIGLGATTELPPTENLKMPHMRMPKFAKGFGSAQAKYQPSSSEGF